MRSLHQFYFKFKYGRAKTLLKLYLIPFEASVAASPVIRSQGRWRRVEGGVCTAWGKDHTYVLIGRPFGMQTKQGSWLNMSRSGCESKRSIICFS